MKGYKRFIIAFILILALYIVTEMNRPKPVDWKITLSKDDKSPYGGYILYQQLKDIYPKAKINSYRLPIYDQINNFEDSNTAYLLIEPDIEISKSDIDELLDYVVSGNYAFLAASSFGRIMDTLKFTTNRRFDFDKPDSSTINFCSPYQHANKNYGFTKMTIDGYFDKIDTTFSVVLGTNQHKDANFIKIAYGDGAFFIHAAPLSFCNQFILKENNGTYTSTALSYLPKSVKTIFWDEYYKSDNKFGGAQTPLRFLLSNVWLRWALRIALFSIVIFVLFEMKRRQRIIPIIQPLRNSTLDFVQTVSNVYFNQRNNKNIALKKINYFFEFVRSTFFLSTSYLNDEFIISLSKKSGIGEKETAELINTIQRISSGEQITDNILVQLNQQIDSFYAKAK